MIAIQRTFSLTQKQTFYFSAGVGEVHHQKCNNIHYQYGYDWIVSHYFAKTKISSLVANCRPLVGNNDWQIFYFLYVYFIISSEYCKWIPTKQITSFYTFQGVPHLIPHQAQCNQELSHTHFQKESGSPPVSRTAGYWTVNIPIPAVKRQTMPLDSYSVSGGAAC